MQENISDIREQGYTIIENVLDNDEVAALKGALAPWLKGEHMGRNDFEGFKSERVYGLLAKDPVLATIIEHPDILSIVDSFLESDYLLSANLAINCHPGETSQKYHRDNNGGIGTNPAYVYGISTIWNLDDFCDDNGATELIPGSHTWTDEIPSEDDPRSIRAIMPAGSVLVFSGTLYHRGGTNHSDGNRLAITPQYCQPWLRQLETMVLSVPPAEASKLSGRVQGLLGYSVRAPGFMGMVNGMHPKRLIDQQYQGRHERAITS